MPFALSPWGGCDSTPHFPSGCVSGHVAPVSCLQPWRRGFAGAELLAPGPALVSFGAFLWVFPLVLSTTK